MLLARVLRVTVAASPSTPEPACAAGPWGDVEARLRPFVARRVDRQDVDDVLQEVYLRMQRGLAGLRDDTRLTPWLYQIARTAIADHLRARQRHPVAGGAPPELGVEPALPERDPEQLLAACVAVFVGRLASPYREAVTLVELEGLTIKDAAAMVGISVSGMKSRVQRGRAQLRELMEACCRIALDVRGKVIDVEPRPDAVCCPR